MHVYLLSYFSRVGLCATLWTVACQAFLSIEFSRQEYWSGLPLASPGHLPNPGIEPRSPTYCRQILYYLMDTTEGENTKENYVSE